MTKSTDELKERMKKSCGWCGRYPACGTAAQTAAIVDPPSSPEAASDAEHRLKPGSEPGLDARPAGEASADPLAA